MSQSNKIDLFWTWFSANESAIINAVEDEALSESIVENLDNLILDIGAFSWEIGSGINRSWYLTISPNENKDLLKISREIIENAPELENWEFNYFKPAKDWNREFVLYDTLMNEQPIDASSWSFISLNQPGEMLKLIIEANNIKNLDEETALAAAHLVVMNEIGEENKINKIASVEIVSEILDQASSSIQKIRSLKEHLRY